MLRIGIEHIERNTAVLVDSHKNLNLVQESIVSEDYLDQISQEISEILED